MAQKVAANGTTVLGPVLRHPRVPWKEIRGLVVMTVLVVALVVWQLVSRFQSGDTPATPAQVEQPAVVPVVSNPQVPQNVQENVGTASPVVADYRIVWTEVQGFNPYTLPVEPGLFSGTTTKVIIEETGAALGGTESPEGRAYALKVYPELLKPTLGMLTAMARDSVDKDVVVMGVFATYNDRQPNTNAWFTSRIALTINSGKSWCSLNLLPVGHGDTQDVRVLANGDSIRLFAGYARPDGLHWWTVTVKKSEVPCS